MFNPNECPLCDWIYVNEAAPEPDVDTAVACHLDLEHPPIEILRELRRAAEREAHPAQMVRVAVTDITDEIHDPPWLD